MKRLAFAVLGALALSAVLALATTVTAKESGDDDRGREARTILKFDTMTPVVAPFTGDVNAIRGTGGGGVPWALKAAEGELRTDGKLEVTVKGLVIVRTGSNPVPAFVAAVNCLTIGSPKNGVTLLTPAVPVGTNGNADFEAKLTLPKPCVAPIVFVGAVIQGSFRWFATTGS
jgi:hypothetical protein